MIRPELLRPSPYTDCAHRSRPVRIRSKAERLADARSSQENAGVVIRICRPVVNTPDFQPELKVWWSALQGKNGTRRTAGKLALTLYDSKQQPLQTVPTYTQEEMIDFLGVRYPDLFKPTPPIKVTGTGLFGNREKPFVALELATKGFLDQDKQSVLGLIAPELLLARDHLQDHRLHVSLGQAALETALIIERDIQEFLPAYVQFGPGRVTVERSQL